MDNLITETILPISDKQLESLEIIKPSSDNDIAIVFDNFLRDELTFNLIKSIFRFSSGVKLYIADQSVYSKNTFSLYEKLMENGHEVIFCGFDCGISNARNKAIEKVKEKYIFMCDSDNLFNKQTQLNDLKSILENNPDMGLISLYEKENNEVNHYENNLERCEDILYYRPIKADNTCRLDNYFLCDYTMNVGLAKKEMLDIIKYDCNMKLAEHLDFFMTIKYKSNWKVACSTVVQIENQDIKIDNEQYNKFRNRNKKYWVMYKEKWNLKQINDYLLNQEDYANPIVKKTEEVIQPIETIINDTDPLKNIFNWLNLNHIPFWLTHKSCLDFINHKSLTNQVLYLGTNSQKAKMDIENYAKNIKLDVKITVETRATKIMKLDNIKISVPMPVVRYLNKTYGFDWEKL